MPQVISRGNLFQQIARPVIPVDIYNRKNKNMSSKVVRLKLAIENAKIFLFRINLHTY